MPRKKFQRGKRGGYRPGSGRKKGGRNRKTVQAVEEVHRSGKMLPLEYMVAVYTDPNQPTARRDVMARAAAPYFHPRISSIDVTGTAHKPAKHTIDVRKLNDDELLVFEQIVAKAGVMISDEPPEEMETPEPIAYLPLAAKTGKLE
jgi:hypothetical protein